MRSRYLSTWPLNLPLDECIVEKMTWKQEQPKRVPKSQIKAKNKATRHEQGSRRLHIKTAWLQKKSITAPHRQGVKGHLRKTQEAKHSNQFRQALSITHHQANQGMVWNISPPWWVTWHESSTKKWFEVQKPENLIQMIKSQRKVKKDHTEWDKPKPKIGPQRHGQRLYATDQQSMTPQERGRAQHSHAMAKHRFLQKEAKAQHNRCESMQKLKLPQNA